MTNVKIPVENSGVGTIWCDWLFKRLQHP